MGGSKAFREKSRASTGGGLSEGVFNYKHGKTLDFVGAKWRDCSHDEKKKLVISMLKKAWDDKSGKSYYIISTGHSVRVDTWKTHTGELTISLASMNNNEFDYAWMFGAVDDPYELFSSDSIDARIKAIDDQAGSEY